MTIRAFAAPGCLAIRKRNRRRFRGQETFTLAFGCTAAGGSARYDAHSMPRLFGRRALWPAFGIHPAKDPDNAPVCQWPESDNSCRNRPTASSRGRRHDDSARVRRADDLRDALYVTPEFGRCAAVPVAPSGIEQRIGGVVVVSRTVHLGRSDRRGRSVLCSARLAAQLLETSGFELLTRPPVGGRSIELGLRAGESLLRVRV